MPIKFSITNNEILVNQSFDSPTVYFDHWAFCEFSDDAMLQERFVKALNDKKGTFVLSITNILEFTKMDDPRNAIAAENFLNRVMPNIYFTDFNLEKAIAFDSHPNFKGQRMWPSADLELLKFVVSKGQKIDFFSITHHNRSHLSEKFNQANRNILHELELKRDDSTYIEKVRRSTINESRQTTGIMGELIRELMIDPKANISENDIVDWQHAILSIRCCDFVLLDSKWVARAKTTKDRHRKQGLDFEFAHCFSKRKKGLYDFLNALEAF